VREENEESLVENYGLVQTNFSEQIWNPNCDKFCRSLMY
jgi:hypothetical protein